MGPKTTPSMISKGGYQIPPPLAWDGINTPLEVGLRGVSFMAKIDLMNLKRDKAN